MGINMKLGTRNDRRSTATCTHEETVSVTHAGLERIICENCPDVRIEYRSQGVGGEVFERERFAREVDVYALQRTIFSG